MSTHAGQDVIAPVSFDHSPARPPRNATPDPDRAVAGRTRQFDTPRLRQDFSDQGAFLYMEDFLAPEVTEQLVASARGLLDEVNRNYLYALYYYTRPGDHIGWHYDTSYYDGRRYTLLLGVIDESSCRLDYELHTCDESKPDVPGSVQIPPGGLVFFDGDKLRHRISPMGENEMRVSLTFEYVTDPNMRPWKRVISNMKDAIAYFGFRQVFRQLMKRGGDAA